ALALDTIETPEVSLAYSETARHFAERAVNPNRTTDEETATAIAVAEAARRELATVPELRFSLTETTAASQLTIPPLGTADGITLTFAVDETGTVAVSEIPQVGEPNLSATFRVDDEAEPTLGDFDTPTLSWGERIRTAAPVVNLLGEPITGTGAPSAAHPVNQQCGNMSCEERAIRMLATEVDPQNNPNEYAALAESLLNRMQRDGLTFQQALGWAGTRVDGHPGYYEYSTEAQNRFDQFGPGTVRYELGEAALEAALRGSNVTAEYTGVPATDNWGQAVEALNYGANDVNPTAVAVIGGQTFYDKTYGSNITQADIAARETTFFEPEPGLIGTIGNFFTGDRISDVE
ncbi:MAG TPA: hypothetical protein VKP88_02470, partial [Candidatus Paceibacterota bacterium]|nr:hypothetical protein [Candidatus Paceibacterota bacterium]